MSTVKFHSAFGLGDCPVGALDCAMPPAAFVMLRRLKLSTRSGQMLQSPADVRLVGASRDVECANYC